MENMIGRQFLLIAIVLPSMAGAAQAAPRDDMLAGISRCTSIADERTFLDCVYGAAQPVRAELGLPPAPQAQISLIPGRGAAGPAKPFAAPPEPRQSGSFLSAILGGGKLESPAAPMASYVFDHNGFFTVTLKNGEVWRQLDDDTQTAHWRKSPPDYTVTVRSGALGTSNLQVAGEGAFYKVRRVR
jgi:hypothetical protein